MSGKLEVSVWDYDMINDEIIGSIEISIQDIIDGRWNNYKFVNVYGAPLKNNNKFAKLMNENSEVGSLWKGKVLIRAIIKKKEKPESSRKLIEKEEYIREAANLVKNNIFEVNATLFDTSFLAKDGKYHIEISIEDEIITFSEKSSVHKYINWGQLTSESFINKETPLVSDVLF